MSSLSIGKLSRLLCPGSANAEGFTAEIAGRTSQNERQRDTGAPASGLAFPKQVTNQDERRRGDQDDEAKRDI